ncbi:MAG: Nudix family hydrolase [Betaproteobacteria bacterium]|nr:Nudix family hydrolase [Betaproteobacteria bacterium]
MVKEVDVAAAVITRPDGSFLLGRRAEGSFYPGYWEFPGGKVEPGETPREALVRELKEELGLTVLKATPWLVRSHRYEHAHVRLHFFEVTEWLGEPNDHVHSALLWQRADKLSVSPMLPANAPVLKALRLPRIMAVTHAAELGVAAQLAVLDQALAHGLRLVQIREGWLDAAERLSFTQEVVKRCRAANAIALINGDSALATQLGADGLHLPSARLAMLDSRPSFAWVGASCHSRAELERAVALELDYALLGPVAETASHPGVPALGWEHFAERVAGLPIPVFAIGGLCPDDLPRAREAGAHGLAAIRGIWS